MKFILEEFGKSITNKIIQELIRKDMPQINRDNFGDMISIFRKYDISYTVLDVDVNKIKQIQDNINTEKVIGITSAILNGEQLDRIIISNDYKIIDGHHRWLAYKFLNKNTIPAIMLNYNTIKSFEIIHNIDTKLNESLLNKTNKFAVVYSGRFQPFHNNHYDVYKELINKFGHNNVYIAMSDKTSPDSPLKFEDKRNIITRMFGISGNKIIKVTNTYVPKEILSALGDNTIYIAAIGEKDSTRLSGKYFKKLNINDDTFEPYKNRGYYFISKLKQNKFDGKLISGTLIRDIFASKDTNKKIKLFNVLYNKFDKVIFELLESKIRESVNILNFISNNNISKIIKESSTGSAFEDDGPNTWFPTFDIYKKISKKRLEKDGFTILNYILNDKDEEFYRHPIYPLGPIGSVSYGPAGMPKSSTTTNQQSFSGDPAYKHWTRHIKKISNLLGWEIIKFENPDLFINENTLLEGEDYIICKECGKKVKQITTNHLISYHNMRIHEYKEKYPNESLQCNSIKLIGNNNPSKRPEVIQKIKNSLKGRNIGFGAPGKPNKHSDESLKKMSINNAMNREECRKKVSIGVKESYNKKPELRQIRSKHFKRKNIRQNIANTNYVNRNWKRPEDRPEFINYLEKVRTITTENYNKYFYEILNAKKRSREWHLDHKYSIHNGFINNIPPEVVGHYKNLEILYHSINESKFSKNSITITELLNDIMGSKNPLDKRILLLCGGAAGHLAHPFDDMSLTFKDLKDMVDMFFSGKIKYVDEKLDGQNLMVTFKNNNIMGARNKSHIKNSASGALAISEMSKMFAGRNEIHDAFVFAMKDLQSAFSSISQSKIEKIFKNGSVFLNLEVMYIPTSNIIPYGLNMLVFHNLQEYDVDGNSINTNIEGAGLLANLIDKTNANIQKIFSIRGPVQVQIPKSEDFSKYKSQFAKDINTLRGEFKLKDSDLIMKYHEAWWTDFILKNSKKHKYDISDIMLDILIKRWAHGNKSTSIVKVKKDIDNKSFEKWVDDFDKKDYNQQFKDNIRPFEILFLKMGTQLLKNINTYIASNPENAVQQIKSEIDKTISDIENSYDIAKISKLKQQLQRVNDIGGFDNIVPSEGIVFMYKGKLFKLTGLFAPINNILGIIKFNR